MGTEQDPARFGLFDDKRTGITHPQRLAVTCTAIEGNEERPLHRGQSGALRILPAAKMRKLAPLGVRKLAWDRYVASVGTTSNLLRRRPGRRRCSRIALAMQDQGLATHAWWTWLEGCAAFRQVSEPERERVVRHMVDNDIARRCAASSRARTPTPPGPSAPSRNSSGSARRWPSAFKLRSSLAGEGSPSGSSPCARERRDETARSSRTPRPMPSLAASKAGPRPR